METVITSLGFGDAGATLSEMILRAGMLERTAFPAVVADFRRDQAQRFDVSGPGWAPLAPSTLARKRQRGQPPDPLIATGALRDSLTKSGAAGSVVRITPDEVFVGTELPHARYHQEGTRRMPQRTLVDVDEGTVERWGAIVQAALAGSSVVAADLDAAVVG